ncbi:DUF6270 domain-containing protein [Oceanirhabdus sp. W0125-5]|uniref:DUF6270 domain-containing protein n=1 Tax=Oceanirhabdus sp. W0125-5 TaxID=2999116 RepID=UPI0022F2E400|nr:DUF6270 domain-containing protein [Oceanirhabdus sp. W0125-5]WBW95597.1 DUF6270 domain-containing protein [Oceanirhabdus sp. W0125-5]
MNFIILGSCVTRDAFNYTETFHVKSYHARSSLISLAHNPLFVDEKDILLDSPFQKRIIKADFTNSLYGILESYKFDYLIIDFIDERFDLLRYGNSFVTRSAEFVNSGLLENKKYKFDRVNRYSVSTHILWEKSCDIFISKIIKLIPQKKIILHKALWASKYIDNNKVFAFPNKELTNIKMNNLILDRYYSYFESKLPNINVIKIDNKDLVADKNHKWGLTPFHYKKDYYLELLRKIHYIVNE